MKLKNAVTVCSKYQLNYSLSLQRFSWMAFICKKEISHLYHGSGSGSGNNNRLRSHNTATDYIRGGCPCHIGTRRDASIPARKKFFEE
jgi:hypothetical protein